MRSPGTRSFVLAALAALAICGCDNPVCVFTSGGCTGDGTGGLGSNPASPPGNLTWCKTTAPAITQIFPSGSSNHPDTPIVLTFNESMSVSSLSNSFQLVHPGDTNQLIPLLPGALTADGRMWVLFPAQPLPADQTYQLIVEPEAVVFDLQGATLAINAQDGVVATFGVAATPPPIPKVVTSWPVNNTDDQAGTGQVVVVFDRKLNASSVNASSFDILVNGAQPAFDPLPQALLVFGAGQTPVTDTRVYTWRSTDSDGAAVELGVSAKVDVKLSPSGHTLTTQDGGTLPATTITYDTMSFQAPAAAEIVSFPTDAIGIDNLKGGSATVPPLEIALTIEDGLPTDKIGVFIVGSSKTAPNPLVSFFRQWDLSEVPYDSSSKIATISEAQLDLANSLSPLSAIVADGNIAFAFQRKRGSVTSVVRLLDTDPDAGGTQSPLLDTQVPDLTGLGTNGTNKVDFRSDTTNFVLVGRADEEISSVEVTTSLGTNGNVPPVAAGSSSGLFIAQGFLQPVFQSPLDPAQMPLPFQIRIYDRAYNASSFSGMQFTQVGAVTGNALPGAQVTVQVFDTDNEKLLTNAKVYTHRESGGIVTVLGQGLTDSQGLVTLPAAGSGETLVTVDLSGYDLFTFDGATTDRVSVPLTRSAAVPALVSGLVSSSAFNISTFERTLSDARLPDGVDPLQTVQTCSTNPVNLQLECPYGPYPVVIGALGAIGVAVTNTPASEFNYSAQSFLQGYALGIPFAPLAAQGTQLTEVNLPSLLSDPSTPLEEQAIDGPALTFDAAGSTGIDLANLAGTPRVLVEGTVPGLRGAAMVGRGVGFNLGGNQWKVRTAYPGRVDPTDTKYPGDEKGELVLDGTVDPDLQVLCELRDILGAAVARRPRLSGLSAVVIAPDAPVVLAPPPGTGHTGSGGFAIDFTDAIPSGLAGPGLYCVTLVGTNGRTWSLYRVDPLGSGTVTVQVPDIAALGGTTLPNGVVGCTVAAYAWQQFAADDFLWTDVGRDFDLFSQSVPVTFQKP